MIKELSLPTEIKIIPSSVVEVDSLALAIRRFATSLETSPSFLQGMDVVVLRGIDDELCGVTTMTWSNK